MKSRASARARASDVGKKDGAGARKRPQPNDLREEFAPSVALANWPSMIRCVPQMTEAELKRALEHEKTEGKRKDFLFRIARRLAKVQNDQNRKELLSA